PSGGAGPFLLPVSAQTPAALRDAARRLGERLEGIGADCLAAVCHTAGARRTHYDERAAVVGADGPDLIERLELVARGDPRPGTARGRRDNGSARRVAFVFSGQGPQWFAMGRDLLASEPLFASVVDRCDELLHAHVSWSLHEELARPEGESRLDQTE